MISPGTGIALAGAAGYLLGSIPFGYLVARAHGVDIFSVGSRNPGATNVRRTLGARAGNTVFALDALKGVVSAGWPLVLVGAAQPGLAGLSLAKGMAMAGMLGSLLGHSYSCCTRFKGGKGVATGAGAFLVLSPLATLAAGLAWLATFLVGRYVSLASIVAAVTLAAGVALTRQPIPVEIAAGAVALFVIVRHRTNIGRLLAGTENRSARKKGGAP